MAEMAPRKHTVWAVSSKRLSLQEVSHLTDSLLNLRLTSKYVFVLLDNVLAM